jgi:glycosyltransferase involved in cell wall biosynthesis
MKPESQPLVSVVTPVYNGEKYLAECIESVLAQTYQNWEYCVVNNCSTDRTLEIAETYANKDKRIRIHNNSEFVGSGQNGNIAFRQISSNSKYCKVVHADDWLFQECIMNMVALAEAHETVAIVSAYRLSNTRITVQALPYASTVIPGREICRNTLLGGPSFFGSPTTLLIRSDELRKRPTFYNVANPHRDMEACLDILRDSDFGFVHQLLTFSRSHSESDSSHDDRFGTGYLGGLEHMTKYGHTYLGEKEYEVCMKKRWDRYYTFLGSMVFRKGKKGFWKFHRNELGRLGYSFSVGKVAVAVFVKLLDLALNPLETSKKIARKLSHFPDNTTR